MKQKAEIIFEQEETVILRQSAGHLLEFCPTCNETVEFLTPEIMAALANGSEREIFRLIESGKIHYIEKERIYGCPICYRNVVVDISAKTPEGKRPKPGIGT